MDNIYIYLYLFMDNIFIYLYLWIILTTRSNKKIKMQRIEMKRVSRPSTVDKSNYMVGSYGPRAAEYDFLTTTEEAPRGLMARGNYDIRSKFTDDDKHDHLSWEWNLNITKDWE